MGGEDVSGKRSNNPGDLLPLTPVALNVLLALADEERQQLAVEALDAVIARVANVERAARVGDDAARQIELPSLDALAVLPRRERPRLAPSAPPALPRRQAP